MVIETKYDKGDEVFIIHKSRIVKTDIKDFLYENGRIYYKFTQIDKKLDRKHIIERNESEVFNLIDELAEYWMDNYVEY